MENVASTSFDLDALMKKQKETLAGVEAGSSGSPSDGPAPNIQMILNLHLHSLYLKTKENYIKVFLMFHPEYIVKTMCVNGRWSIQ